MGTHPIFESDFDCLTDFGYLKTSQNAKGKESKGRSSSSSSSQLGQKAKGEEDHQSIVRKTAPQLWNWSAYPTQAGSHPFCAMAQVHPSSPTKSCFAETT